jgi:O-antigen ligase
VRRTQHCHRRIPAIRFCEMPPALRQALIAIVCTALAVWMGIELANGAYLWPALVGGIAVAAILSRALGLPFDVVLLGLVLAGYIVANRGFAQLVPAPGVPLLPAELALLIAGIWRIVQWAHERRLPFERDPLHLALVGLLVTGTARFGFDFPRHGLLAVRDFAVVYYAAFFFVARHMASDERARNYLLSCIGGALLLLPIAFALSETFPAFFLQTLTVHGGPLFFYKADLVFAFVAIAIVWWYFRAPTVARRPMWIGLLVLFVWLGLSDNRSSQLGLAVVLVMLVAARRWRLPAVLGGVALAGLLALVALAFIGNNAWAERKLEGMRDRAVSLTDFTGARSYSSEESHFKGDNNRFRTLWWKSVATEVWQNNPALGLGFGHDLARGFLQEYNPLMMSEEFGVRSPHNIFVTYLGRLGGIGLALWAVISALIVVRAWRALRRASDLAEWAPWAGIVILLVSATFGVVLEGPMGALPFWVLLGLGRSDPAEEKITPSDACH